jgi:hypothetical protein
MLLTIDMVYMQVFSQARLVEDDAAILTFAPPTSILLGPLRQDIEVFRIRVQWRTVAAPGWNFDMQRPWVALEKLFQLEGCHLSFPYGSLHGHLEAVKRQERQTVLTNVQSLGRGTDTAISFNEVHFEETILPRSDYVSLIALFAPHLLKRLAIRHMKARQL